MAIESEKKNLEMHVELDALRATAIIQDITQLKEAIQNILDSMQELEKKIEDMQTDRNNQLIKLGGAIIVTLVSALGMLVLRVIFPMLMSKVQ